jgi:hypothetical protein
MVWIHDEDRKKYPNFSDYVLRMVPNARNEPDMFPNMILAAFEYRQIFQPDLLIQAGNAMGIGPNPRITWSLEISQSFAIYHPWTQVIILNELYVLKVENDHKNWGAQQFAKATVLHEMVHHIDFIIDKTLQDYDVNNMRRKSDVKERGEVFEEMAFGSKVTGSW